MLTGKALSTELNITSKYVHVHLAATTTITTGNIGTHELMVCGLIIWSQIPFTTAARSSLESNAVIRFPY